MVEGRMAEEEPEIKKPNNGAIGAADYCAFE